MYYASFGVLALILHIIINFDILRIRKKDNASVAGIRYRNFLFAVMAYYISDILWGFLYENGPIPLAYADTVLYFFTMVVSVVLWTGYVVEYLNTRSVFGKILKFAGWFIFVYEILSLLYNFFVPVIFKFDENNVYVPGFARYFTLGLQIILFTMTAVYSLANAYKTKDKVRRHYVTIGLSGIVMTAFIILQTLFPLLPFYAVGCLIASCLIHTFVAVDEKIEHDLELGTARQMAYTDSLTGVKNVHAYTEAKEALEKRISDGTVDEFGIVVFDLNDLKKINDSLGHEEGDRYIREASRCICLMFKHSPVYRIGGDEFAVLLQGEDYKNREDLIASFNRQIDENRAEGRVVVSGGMAEYKAAAGDDFDTVFELADHRMYERKKSLKENE